MTKEQRQIKQKEKTDEIKGILNKLPYKICYSTELIVKAGLIEPTDLELTCFDKFLRKAENSLDWGLWIKVLTYNTNNILSNDWKDGRGLTIVYKFKYFRNAVIHGLCREGVDQEIIQSLFED